ncbi:putative asmA protein (plasmid) [Legionella adelaidensis]|uniref:Putative asmA protein n=1 Tax=Legionella adelaidensis TaxID=45056 RepID=A0A0W0R1E7_9GAMM|nr:AsmA family protein [Legionella adelaidensis]KTC64915.1 putative asmA protein [Legionella adelaidensis]VEH85598.1 putative asmA protein [Legionella adelaidensis]
MMNLIQKIIFSLIALGLVSFIFIWYLTKSVSLEVIHDLFNKQLSELTPLHSEIKGNIRWQIFPKPGVKITNVKLENVSSFPHYALFIEDVFLNLQWGALFKGKLVFTQLHADDFTLTFNLNEKNHEIQAVVTKPKEQQVLEKVKKIPQFSINNLLLTHGQITILYGDKQFILSGLQMGATQLNLHNDFFPIIVKGNLLASLPNDHFSSSFHFKGRTHLKALILNPIKFLKEKGLEGQLTVTNLRYKDIAIDTIKTTLLSSADELILNPLNLSLYGGESVGDLSYNFVAQKLSINQTATTINSNHLINNLLGLNLVNGLLDFSIHASVRLKDDNWKDDIQGNGSLTIKEGVLYGINLNKLAKDLTSRVHALFTNDELDLKLALKPEIFRPISYENGQTHFDLLSIQYRLHNSFFLNDTLLLQTNNLQLSGNGHINLQDLQVDNELGVKLLTQDVLLEKLQTFLNGNLPLRLTGKITNPVLVADADKINPFVSKVLLEKSLHQPIKHLKNSLKNLLNEIS